MFVFGCLHCMYHMYMYGDDGLNFTFVEFSVKVKLVIDRMHFKGHVTGNETATQAHSLILDRP